MASSLQTNQGEDLFVSSSFLVSKVEWQTIEIETNTFPPFHPVAICWITYIIENSRL